MNELRRIGYQELEDCEGVGSVGTRRSDVSFRRKKERDSFDLVKESPCKRQYLVLTEGRRGRRKVLDSDVRNQIGGDGRRREQCRGTTHRSVHY